MTGSEDERSEGEDPRAEAAGVSGGAEPGEAGEGTGDAEAAGGLLGLIRSRGPQKAVLMLAVLVLALFVLVAWFVVARGDEGPDETEVGTEDEAEGAPAAEPTEPPESTTTVPETTTTLSPEEAAEQEVIEAYEAALDARDEAWAVPDPEHPALEETHTGYGLEDVKVDTRALDGNGNAVRYPEDSVWEVDVQEVTFRDAEGVEVAVLEVCEVTDAEQFDLDTGAVIESMSGVWTLERTVEMQRVDGIWKVAEVEPLGGEEGVGGCARD